MFLGHVDASGPETAICETPLDWIVKWIKCAGRRRGKEPEVHILIPFFPQVLEYLSASYVLEEFKFL